MKRIVLFKTKKSGEVVAIRKEFQMNSVLKNLVAPAIALFIVLTFSVALKWIDNSCCAPAINIAHRMEDQNNRVASRSMLTFADRLSAYGSWRVISPIPACLERTPCPLNTVNSEKCMIRACP